jgi:streptogramin lyase
LAEETLGGITAGPDGNLWFTETDLAATPSPSKIGRITPKGVVTEFPVSPTNALLGSITAGPDGNLWFVEFVLRSSEPTAGPSKIGRITPNGALTEFPIYASAEGPPEDIVAGPDGNLWFTELEGHIEKITPNGVITEFSLPSGQRLFGITGGPDGNLWFTETDLVAPPSPSRVGRITPQGAITEFPVPMEGSAIGPIGGITAGSDRNVWFTKSIQQNGGGIARITP